MSSIRRVVRRASRSSSLTSAPRFFGSSRMPSSIAPMCSREGTWSRTDSTSSAWRSASTRAKRMEGSEAIHWIWLGEERSEERRVGKEWGGERGGGREKEGEDVRTCVRREHKEKEQNGTKQGQRCM